jgi:imidazoleglycerol phosphate dehydratase HisB
MTMERNTKECSIRLDLRLEPGMVRVDSGIGFLDHLLSSLAFHAGLAFSWTARATSTWTTTTARRTPAYS